MARAGLGPDWTCLFANDRDARKAGAYQANWGAAEFRLADVADLSLSDLPGRADLAWASFPCQDLSLAGPGAGLDGARSGAFRPFWRTIGGLAREGRAPRLVALENVCGALTSNQGRDFAALCACLVSDGYRIGGLVLDAELFVPQSRPRLFLVGARSDLSIPEELTSREPRDPFHPISLRRAAERAGLDPASWIWWILPTPPRRNLHLVDLLEDEPGDVVWSTRREMARLTELMAPNHLAKLEEAKRAGRRMAGGLYRRTRPSPEGGRMQRAEVRFDGVAGCLRTPRGGSSRQRILLVEGQRVRSRLLSARETARLMGLEDSYRLPAAYTEAYRLTGDGVVAPVVRHLARHLFEPLCAAFAEARAAERSSAA